MWKFILGSALAWAASIGHAADLTATEQRWLQGAWPVITYAKQIQLPLDIVVQPQPTPGNAPLALGFVDGRCKLVLSMRGNPEAEDTLKQIPADLLDAALELMAAHELGHCRRYLDGAWKGVPAGFTAAEPEGLTAEQKKAFLDMRATRREEGYGDLMGLAWTQRAHPELYARLHAWLVDTRHHDLIPGSHHDTLAWLRQAGDGKRLARGTLFDSVNDLWKSGLAAND